MNKAVLVACALVVIAVTMTQAHPLEGPKEESHPALQQVKLVDGEPLRAAEERQLAEPLEGQERAKRWGFFGGHGHHHHHHGYGGYGGYGRGYGGYGGYGFYG